MEVRKAKMIANKSGAGSSTFRATLPSSWVREMGLDEEKRNLKLYFDGERIIIKNNDNEEEIRMLKKFAHLEELEHQGLIPATREDEKVIQEHINNLAIDERLTIDDALRVYYNDIYIADLKQI